MARNSLERVAHSYGDPCKVIATGDLAPAVSLRMRYLWCAILLAACDGTAATGDASAIGDGAQGDAPGVADAVRRVHQRRRRHRLVRRRQVDRRADPDLVDRGVSHRRQLPRVSRRLPLRGRRRAIASARTRSIRRPRALTFINDVASGGTGPAHVAVDRTGEFVLVANYGSGHIAVMPVQGNGGLAAASQTDPRRRQRAPDHHRSVEQVRGRAVPRRRQGRAVPVRRDDRHADRERGRRSSTPRTAPARGTSRSRPTASTRT